MKQFEQPDTHLSGWRLTLGRTAWVFLFLVEVAVFAMALPVWFNELLKDPYQLQTGLSRLGLTIEFFALYSTSLQIILALALITIALVIFWRKSDDWMGLLVSIGQLGLMVAVLPDLQTLPRANPAWNLPALLIRIVGLALGVLVFYLFPDGRFVPKWTSWLELIFILYMGTWILLPGTAPPPMPIDIHNSMQTLTVLIMFFLIGSGVFAQVYRYRTISNPVQRQQTKWVVFGFGAVFVGVALSIFPMILFPSLRIPGLVNTLYLLIEIPLVLFSIFLLPLSIGVSILRYHLWDIDILIRRTLIYGALTVTLVTVYLVAVLLLQQGFVRLTGQKSPIAVVISTLAIATLFTSLRRRIQNDIDRRFYRKKYDAARTLEAFSTLVREDVELEQLTTHLLAVVEETMQPVRVSLWLTSKPEKPPVRTDAAQGEQR